MGGEHVLVHDGVFKQFFHHIQQPVHLLRRDAVETEAGGLLALPEEVLEEVVKHVAMLVEQ